MWSIFFAEVGVITQFVKSNELSISSVICKMYSVISFFYLNSFALKIYRKLRF